MNSAEQEKILMTLKTHESYEFRVSTNGIEMSVVCVTKVFGGWLYSFGYSAPVFVPEKRG